MPQDFEITDPKIMVLENGSVAGPLTTKYVLSKLDVKTESLRMIRPYVPKGSPLPRKGGKAATAEDGGGEDGEAAAATTQEEQFALCEIVNKKEAFQKEQERKQLKKENAKPKTKEMELTWAISEHDLQTKLRQLTGFLNKGMKVQLVLGTKRGGRKVDEETAKALMNKIRDEVQALGAREVTPANGDLGRTMRMNFEGVAKKQT
ncbi:Translation initiation factor 3 [Beauveria brongniartii RCEF 3172]|uniref:Translation initiation factor 3 n=1 Tax=Beauveria brongniartii RCEF 3172 TaxID=1081107 RepID=A0A166WV83_9HYPO|nr:Translation initiation factor 3 [Beauveria brongniartii RCEF 3172]